MVELVSARVKLRRLELKDIDAFHKAYNSDFVRKYNVMNKLDKEDIQKMVLGEMLNEDSWAIEEIESGLFVGMIYKQRDSLRFDTNTCELSFWLSEEFAGKGYMKEALESLIAFLFIELKLSGISIRVFEDNERSQKLIQKLHFEKEGRLENAVRSTDGVIHNDILYYRKNEFLNKE